MWAIRGVVSAFQVALEALAFGIVILGVVTEVNPLTFLSENENSYFENLTFHCENNFFTFLLHAFDFPW